MLREIALDIFEVRHERLAVAAPSGPEHDDCRLAVRHRRELDGLPREIARAPRRRCIALLDGGERAGKY